MIVVKIELHSAITRQITTLGTMVIDNIGGTREKGNYRVRVGRKGSSIPEVQNKPLRVGSVTDYPRLSYNIWRLILRALQSAFPEG